MMPAAAPGWSSRSTRRARSSSARPQAQAARGTVMLRAMAASDEEILKLFGNSALHPQHDSNRPRRRRASERGALIECSSPSPQQLAWARPPASTPRRRAQQPACDPMRTTSTRVGRYQTQLAIGQRHAIDTRTLGRTTDILRLVRRLDRAAKRLGLPRNRTWRSKQGGGLAPRHTSMPREPVARALRVRAFGNATPAPPWAS